MDTIFKIAVASQFGAAINMLDNALRACPDELVARPFMERLFDAAANKAVGGQSPNSRRFLCQKTVNCYPSIAAANGERGSPPIITRPVQSEL